ncbi:hypothetical protein Tco_1376443 [Tanacetum coccineum]
MTFATSEIAWILKILKDLNWEHFMPVTLFCASQAAIKIAANPVFHERTKHLEIDFLGKDMHYPFTRYLADATCRVVIPLNNSCDDDAKVEIVANEKDNGDKKNWLSSTHFWNTNDNLETVEEKEEMRAVIIRLLHLYYRIMSAEKYSGGMKTTLTVAISLIGDPKDIKAVDWSDNVALFLAVVIRIGVADRGCWWMFLMGFADGSMRSDMYNEKYIP